MLNTFPFDPCSSEKTLDYSGVPELFGIYELVLLTPPASSSSGARRFPLCAASAPAARRRSRAPSATSSCKTLPRVIPSQSRLLSSPLVASPTRATTCPSPFPAATSSPSWTGYPGALTLSLSRAAAPQQHPHAELLLPVSNFPEAERHFLAVVPFLSGRASTARGQPTPDHLRSSQHTHKLTRSPLVLPDHSWSSNFC
jgi:hypothetical protein